MLEARRRFRLFVVHSQIAGTKSFGKSVKDNFYIFNYEKTAKGWRGCTDQTGLQHLENVSGFKLATYESAKTLWHYILARSSG